jgi:phage shock protein E
MIRCFALAVLCVSALTTIGLAQEKDKHTTDSLETVKKNLADGKAILVDVREKSEWDAGHLKLAILLPSSHFSDATKHKEVAEKSLDKKKIVYTHCKAGGRAARCGEYLKGLGYDVRPLKPGYEELLKAGFEKADAEKKDEPNKP